MDPISDLGPLASDTEQLPASSYTPMEIELLDRREIDGWLDSISGRLEGIKRDFAILYPEETRRLSAAATALELEQGGS